MLNSDVVLQNEVVEDGDVPSSDSVALLLLQGEFASLGIVAYLIQGSIS